MYSKTIYESLTEPKGAIMNGRICVKVTFADGNTLVSELNGTLETARAYYVGKKFQFGDTRDHPGDQMVEAVKVEELKN